MNYPIEIRESEWVIGETEPAYSEPVNCVEFGNGYGSVLCTSAKIPARSAGRPERERLKRLSAIRLVQFATRESGTGIPEADAITVSTTPLGCPRLMIGSDEGPSVSFAWSNGTVWTALGSGDYSVGIDVAGAAEFEESYPLRRAFNRSELRIAMGEVRGNIPEASALLWTVKESAVKALGCGFHLVDPLQVRATARRDRQHRKSFSMVLADKAERNLGLGCSPFLEATAMRKHGLWLAVALFNPA